MFQAQSTLVLSALLLMGCGSGSGGSSPAPAPVPDFTLAVTPPASLQAGSQGTATATTARSGGHAAAITLSLAANSQNITGSGSIAAGAASGTLSLTVPASAAVGTHALQAIGSDGSLQRSASFNLVVQAAAAPDFSLTLVPSFLTVNRGAASSATVQLARTGGFSAQVVVTCQNLPAGVTAAPLEVLGTSGTLTFTASAGATTGTSTVQVRGASEALQHSADLQLTVASPPVAVLAAFPGAEGFGAAATGGRGGRVLYVTTLATDPFGTTPGSFQWACNQVGARYILFKVSGLIDQDIQLTRGDVTIAGHTSPGGIIVRQFHTTEDPYCDGDPGCLNNPATRKAVNWVLRHLRMRPANGGFDDALRLLSTRLGIVDHCSMANAEDECVQVSQCNDITLQNCILAETIGDHANLGGMLLNYSVPAAGLELDRITIVKNVWNRLLGRMPELSRESPAAGGSTLNLELSNNLLWDPGFYVDVNQTTVSGSDAGQPVYYALNWVGNFAFARSDFPFGMMSFPVNAPTGASATFFSGNRMNLYPARQDYQLLYCCNDYPATLADPAMLPYPDVATPPRFARSTRHPFPAIAYLDSNQVRGYASANAGAFPRDPMDRRLMGPLGTGTLDPAPRDQNPYGDALRFDWTTAPPAPADTDEDGMPDAWEQAAGLNANDPADGQSTTLSLARLGVAGYPNLEVYLHELHLQRMAAASRR